MPSSQPHPSSVGAFPAPLGVFGPAMEYMVDAAQRSVLFWDVMRQRGNQYREHLAETAPHVLDYEVELVLDGRTLDRPVNYGLVRVVPPPGVELDATRRPFVIVDPRAFHMRERNLEPASKRPQLVPPLDLENRLVALNRDVDHTIARSA